MRTSGVTLISSLSLPDVSRDICLFHYMLFVMSECKYWPQNSKSGSE